MKATFDSDKLAEAFHLAASIAPTKSPQPILENVKLEVDEYRAVLIATDLETEIRVDVPGVVEVTETGQVLLPARNIGTILTQSVNEKLSIGSSGVGYTEIDGFLCKFQLVTHDPDDFPVAEPFHVDGFHQLPAQLLRQMINRTVFAIDPESTRYALGGVLFEVAGDRITAVATDGRRLAWQECPAESRGGHEMHQNTVIPARALELIERALADNEENVQIAAHENKVVVKNRHTMITTQLVEGRFPQWRDVLRDVLPDASKMTSVEMVVGPLQAAVRKAAIVGVHEYRGVVFTFGGQDRLTLTGHGPGTGDSRVKLPIPYDGPEIPIKLDPNYVSDCLRVLDPDQKVTLAMRDAESAVVFRTADGYAYVLLPLCSKTPKGDTNV